MNWPCILLCPSLTTTVFAVFATTLLDMINLAVIAIFAIDFATRTMGYVAEIAGALSVLTTLVATGTVDLGMATPFPLSWTMALKPLPLFLRLAKLVEHLLLTT